MGKVVGARDFYRKLTSGFTLMELMVVLVLIGITSSFAVGAWRKIHSRMQARASVERLLVVFHQARSDATSKERRAGVALSEDSSVSFEAAGTTRKGIRYLRFVDAAGGMDGFLDDDDTIVQDWTPLEGKVFAYSGSSSGYSNGVASIVFHFDGSTDNDLRLVMGAADFNDTFRLNLLPATGLATMER